MRRPLLIMVMLWAILRLSGVDMPYSSVWVWILFIPMLVSLFVEFQRSMDIMAYMFARDLLLAILSVVMTTITITYIVVGSMDVRLIDMLVALVVFIDAWMSTTNSFRMALRNLSGNINHGPTEEGMTES